MTATEIKHLHTGILNRLLRGRMKEAFSDLGYLIQQNGFGLAYDEMTQMETTYRYLLRYAMEGYQDNDRDKVLMALQRDIAALADAAYRQWMSLNSSDYYYIHLRNRLPFCLSEGLKAFQEIAEKAALLNCSDESDQEKSAMLDIKKQRESKLLELFQAIFFSERWTDEVSDTWQRLFDSLLSETEQAFLVSALWMALSFYFDEKKILFLAELCLSSMTEVSKRALVAMVLVLDRYAGRALWYPSIKARVELLFEDESRRSALQTIFLQLIRAKDVEQVSKRMQEEILPEMTKLGSTIQRKMENPDNSDDMNPDWKEMFDNADLSEKMQEFSELQLQGVDVYMSTFSALKYYPFFKELAHWFLPFDAKHSSVSNLFEVKGVLGIDVLGLVTSSGFLCSSDKYSFCFNLNQVPEEYRSQMTSQIGAESESFEEIQKMEQSGQPHMKQEMVSNRYIQDLYRFYKLFPSKKDFQDVFASPLNLYENSLLAPYLEEEDKMLQVAAFYFKNKHYEQALPLYLRLSERRPQEVDLHRKCAYCHQQLQAYSEALKRYLQADLMQDDHLWTLKRIASCYRQLKQMEQALEYYRRAACLDENNLSLCLNIGHCLMELKQYQEAMNYYYKAEFVSSGMPKTWRPLSWCAMLCGKYEQADKYMQKILAQKPEMVDFLNAGHIAWLQGYMSQAAEMYKKGIRQTHTALIDFLELFEKDLPLLMERGVRAEDVSIMRDGLLYRLEE